MKKVTEKKVARKVAKFFANVSNDVSNGLIGIGNSTPSRFLCLINAGLLNGFTREEIFDIFIGFGEIENLIMIERKSYCILSFKNECAAAESYEKLNGSFCLKGDTQALYLSYLENFPTNLVGVQENPKVWPNGLKLKENFISEEEEEKLLGLTLSDPQTLQLKHRTVKHYGFEFKYGSNKVDRNPLPNGIPEEMEPIITKLVEFGMARPDQLTVNHYAPGQGIPLHTDTHSSFEDGIVSISLGSDIVMDFMSNDDGRRVSIVLPRRSCLIISQESRYSWSHGITPRKYDVTEAADHGLTVVRRENRTSLTFRKVRTSKCDCTFFRWCDSRLEDSVDLSGKTADNIERNHVFRVYDEIATHFSETRHSPWPNVKAFIESFPAGSLLLDIGCGNGKYLMCSQSLFSIGTDRSKQLLNVCRKRGYQVVNADCRASPFRDDVADAAICIAVIHHLATEDRRLQTLQDISRILRKGGRALVYVWAKEQEIGKRKSTYLLQKKSNASRAEVCPTPETYSEAVLPVHINRTDFKHADVLVPWSLNSKESTGTDTPTYLRFYHVFKEGELDSLCSKISNISICRSYYDQGNWCIEFEKK
ncbi:hypothetical protein GHT06_015201 [Daphnia sinensis]|uniref:tRNA (carboxymethyluridine(34)-5-O)-methyltransferase n=1 Tax=Daphnia sinensis TaxID=1820382 RepID=A0AAD5PVW7_9CRUS|nr:hypothetical protein GHT06_015201 [Daphnia sinensis]